MTLDEGSPALDVLHALGEGVTLADRNGRIWFSNRAADRILGIGATHEDPERWADHYGVFLPDRVTPFPTADYPLVRALAGEETRDVEMWIRNAGVPHGVLIAATGRPMLDREGALQGAAVVFRDITALRAAEDELRRSNRELAETQRRKDELAGFLVHDLKSPLTGILGLTDILMTEGRFQGDDLDALRHIGQAAATIHRMVLDLLDIQLAHDRGLEPRTVPVDPQQLLADVREALAPRAALSGHEIVVREPVRSLAVAADPDLLRRVVQNLADNCLKYAPPGRIVMGARPLAEASVLVEVEDSGPGVPLELRERIFEMYAKAEREEGSRHRDSRGLGLRFCRVVADAHGGRIWVEDNEPVGSRFCLQLPAG